MGYRSDGETEEEERASLKEEYGVK